MAVPMRKISKRRTRMRASHHAIQPRNLRACPQCGHMGPAHRVCGNCGHYAGRTVVDKDE